MFAYVLPYAHKDRTCGKQVSERNQGVEEMEGNEGLGAALPCLSPAWVSLSS